jgi:Uma2 family endonuclease
MDGAAPDRNDTTVEAFNRFVDDDASGAEFELIDGEIVMMTNPTEAHEQLVANFGAPLKLAMDPLRCRTYLGGMRVQAGDDASARDKYIPDIVVRCGPRDDKRTYIVDPVVVVEVLSPSTMDNDRGPKLKFYKLRASLRHIVLVYSDQMRVEHYARNADVWRFEALTRPAETLSLDAVGFAMTLEALYFDLAL